MSSFSSGYRNILMDWLFDVSKMAKAEKMSGFRQTLEGVLEGARGMRDLKGLPGFANDTRFNALHWKGKPIDINEYPLSLGGGQYIYETPKNPPKIEIGIPKTSLQFKATIGHELGHDTSLRVANSDDFNYIMNYIDKWKPEIDEPIIKAHENATKYGRIGVYNLDWLLQPIEMIARDLESRLLNKMGKTGSDFIEDYFKLNNKFGGYPYPDPLDRTAARNYYDWYFGSPTTGSTVIHLPGQSYPKMRDPKYNEIMDNWFRTMVGD